MSVAAISRREDTSNIMTQTVLGVDVGTGSARAGLFDARGHCLALHSHPIEMWRYGADFAEQSSADIWRAIGICTRECLQQSGDAPDSVAGISFDATCSMVVVGQNGEGLPVNAQGEAARDIIVWMDHRARAEAQEINAGEHEVLRYVGGTISPEMQTPKLLWLRRHLRRTWDEAAQFFDLADWLTWRSCGSLSRSHCTLVCKWTYLADENGGRWDEDYFRAIGIGDALGRIGETVQPMGTPLGFLSARAAAELGLTTGCRVGQGIIDAHAGGLGVVGGVWGDAPRDLAMLERALALIGGTSNCHMAVSRAPRFVPGVWGPYRGAMVPEMWLCEGGQSTAGAAIDWVIDDHPHAPTLRAEAARDGQTVYQLLNAELARAGDAPTLSRDFHVLPYFLGNRSPHADAGARALYDGVSLDNSRLNLAVRYLATVQAVAYGTRDIIAALNANGFSIETIIATGGGTKNPLWLREHADATGLPLSLPAQSEAVLQGTAMLAARAAGFYADLPHAMQAMSAIGATIAPRANWKPYHDAKFEIFRSLYREQKARRERMSAF